MPRIIIDTDPGQDIDDLLAIHFALRRPELEILAITTVTWPSDQRARLVRRLLRHCGREGIPVAAGMQHPLRRLGEEERKRLHDPAWSMNHRCFAEPEEAADAAGDDGVGLIIRTLEAASGPVTLCCIAPLTNLACVLLRRPDLQERIERVLLMGGETALNRAEHNIAFDPVAADVVIGSGLPVAMGTWDVTRRFVLSPEDLALYGDGSPLGRAMTEAIAAWHPVQNWKPGPVMYDLFPMVQAFDPSFYTLAPQQVRVAREGEGRGLTLPGGGAAVQVTTEVRVDALRELWRRTIRGR